MIADGWKQTASEIRCGRGVMDLAQHIADYLAVRSPLWPDQQAMREAVHETVRLLYTEAIFEAYRLMIVAHDEGDVGDATSPLWGES